MPLQVVTRGLSIQRFMDFASCTDFVQDPDRAYFTASNARVPLQSYLISPESYTGAQSCKDKVARTSKFTSSKLTLCLVRQLCISVQNAIYLVTESSHQAYGSLDLLSNLSRHLEFDILSQMQRFRIWV